MADVLSELRDSLEKRLRELEPLIKEHAQVRKALDALKGVGKRAQGTAAGAARRSRTARTATAARGPGRPRGTGARAQEVLKHAHKQPGITLVEMANRMKIQPSYLPLPRLLAPREGREDHETRQELPLARRLNPRGPNPALELVALEPR